MRNSLLKFAYIVFLLCFIIGLVLENPRSISSDPPKDRWSEALTLRSEGLVEDIPGVLEARAESLNAGFLFPKMKDTADVKAVQSRLSTESGLRIPDDPIVLATAYKSDSIIIYVSEDDQINGYGIGQETVSGWVIVDANLNSVDFAFENVQLTLDIINQTNIGQ